MTAPTPAISGFTDGVVCRAADLNSLGSNLTNLYRYTMGGFRTLKPQCEVRITNTSFSVPDSTETQITWDAADINTDNMWSGTNPGQFTIVTAGTYLLYCQVVVTGSNSTYAVKLLVNGTNPSTNGVSTFSGSSSAANVTAIVPLAAGATVYGFVRQSSGGSVTLVSAIGGCRMAAYFISP